jgi:hypothetical protein
VAAYHLRGLRVCVFLSVRVYLSWVAFSRTMLRIRHVMDRAFKTRNVLQLQFKVLQLQVKVLQLQVKVLQLQVKVLQL